MELDEEEEEEERRRDAGSGDEATSEDLVEVSEKTHKLLTSACTRSVPNETRRRLRGRYQLPKVVATKAPNVDAFMRTEISSTVKALDKDLSKIQSFVLDALAPLTTLLEFSEDMKPPDVYEAAATAAELIGNASSRISRLRREKIVASVNKSLLPLAKEEEPYSEAPPNLFGADFARRSKDFVEQVKALRSSLPARGSHREQAEGRKFFRRGPPSKRGGQRSGRGGVSNRFQQRDRSSHQNSAQRQS